MILHIDMDAFFASVEQLDNPHLKGKCVIVGGLSNRSVVSAASYEARKFGIHSAMPMYRAKQKCPRGIFLPPRMNRYKEVSKKIMSLLKTFSPLVEPVSIDEAYMDITGCKRLHGKPEEVALNIKKKIKETVNLTCSVGIAPNKFLSKIASDMDKPDGLTIIMPDNVQQFIEFLPIYKVPGVGKKMKKHLELMGIKMLGDVKKYPEKMLLKRFGKFGQRLIKLSACIDNSPVTPCRHHKSVSSEETLSEDTRDKKLLNNYLLMHSENVVRELRRMGVRAKTITLKIKHADFQQVTRSVTLTDPTQSSETIYMHAVRLLRTYKIIKKIRLIGVGASGLFSDAVPLQMDLFDGEKKRNRNWEEVDKAIDIIIQKYGKDAIKRATLKKSKCQIKSK